MNTTGASAVLKLGAAELSAGNKGRSKGVLSAAGIYKRGAT